MIALNDIFKLEDLATLYKLTVQEYNHRLKEGTHGAHELDKLAAKVLIAYEKTEGCPPWNPPTE